MPWNDHEKDILWKLSVNDDLFILAEEKGVDSEILKIIETKLLNKGCPKINLFVRNTNLRVQAFYKKNKYKIQESQIYGKRLIEDN